MRLVPPPAATRDGARNAASAHFTSPCTPLLGRDAEVAAVERLLLRDERRVVTLTGTGGVGKTRLAAAVATAVRPSFPDGTVFVPLAAVADPASVLDTVARSVGVTGTEGGGSAGALTDYLSPLRLLLVLDNLERLLDAADDLAALVAACPRLVVLVTSRAPLRIRGETEFRVQPLALPPCDAADEAAVAASPAGAVFLERARSVAPDFAVTARNASAIAAICRQLAGIPLALELAASRVRYLDPHSLLARLDDAMRGAGGRDLPARQQTMRATFDWSYDLLSPQEQRLLRMLSVFIGGCTLEALEAVATGVGAGDEVLPSLEVLVEQSLVTVVADADGCPRYRMLEPVAQYAAARMSEDERSQVRSSHAACYRAFAERAALEYLAADQVVWLDRTDRDDANLRAAIGWALETRDGATAAGLGWSLWLYWWLRGQLLHGQQSMERALELELPPAFRTRVLLTVATMAFARGDIATADARWLEAQRAARTAGGAIAQGLSHDGVGLVALVRGDLDQAEEHFLRALAHGDGQGPQGSWMQSLTWVWLGTVQMLRGDLARARLHAQTGLDSARRRGDRLTAYIALYNLSQAAIAQGEHDEARRYLREGIRLTEETRDRANLAYLLEALAVVEAESGDPHRVGLLVGAAEAAREQVGGPVYGYYQPDAALRERSVQAAQNALGPDRYDDTVDAGRSLTPEEAVAYALNGASNMR